MIITVHFFYAVARVIQTPFDGNYSSVCSQILIMSYPPILKIEITIFFSCNRAKIKTSFSLPILDDFERHWHKFIDHFEGGACKDVNLRLG